MAIIQILPSIVSGMVPFSSGISEICAPCLGFDDNMQTLEENLQVLTSILSDIDRKLEKEELLGKKRMSMEVQNWFENVCHIKIEFAQLQDQFCKRLCRGNDAKKLKEKVEKLIKQSDTFRALGLDGNETTRNRLFTTQLNDETMNQELDNIMAWLEEKYDQVAILGIHGMGGVGKTTVVKHIYNRICTNFHGTHDKFHVFWVTVSEDADINKLQNDLAKKMNSELPQYYDVEEKASFLQKLLSEKKNVVLILDDVWNFFDLNQIGITPGAGGCRVIITTCLLNVCNEMGCKKIIKIQPLAEEAAWRLFLSKLDCDDKLSPEVEDVAKQMAKKCDGLPLAIITVARSMIRVYELHRWRNAYQELTRSMRYTYVGNEVMPELLYSYNCLKDQRKQHCFLYCSLYPEDYLIRRCELIKDFICEGVMDQRDTWIANIDQANTILDELVNTCLLESVEDGVGDNCVKMHDMLREMAVEITRNNPKFMIKAGLHLCNLPDEQEWTEDLDKVSLMFNNISEIPEGLSPRCHRLSTLILSKNPLKLIPDSFFVHMLGLRVLNLSYNKIEKLPSSISELENLNALLLGCCYNLKYLPSLRKLKELKELDIFCTGIMELTDGMECLVRLRYLNMGEMKNLVKIQRGLLPQLSRLQHLIVPEQIKVPAEEFESLKLLEHFKGVVKDNKLNFNLLNKSPPFSYYNITVGDGSISANLPTLINGDYKYTIRLHNFAFRESAPTLPHKIQHLEIGECKGMNDCLLDFFPSLNNCTNLRACGIQDCNDIESVMVI